MAIPTGNLYAAIIALGTVIVVGCTPIPLAENYRISTQFTLRTAHHWQLLAQQTGEDIRKLKLPFSPDLYVISEGAVRSPFSKAFESYLADKLIQSCHPTCNVTQGHTWRYDDGSESSDSTHTIYIQYGVQRIQHRASLKRPTFGLFTLLGTGVWLGHQASARWSAAADFPAAIGEGAAIDLLSGVIAAPTHTEVIVTYVVLDQNGSIQFRSSKNYYVSDADAGEYPDLPLYSGIWGREPKHLVQPIHVGLSR